MAVDIVFRIVACSDKKTPDPVQTGYESLPDEEYGNDE